MWNAFINLDFNGKVVAIALYILGVLLVILWARFITKRFNGGILYRLIASSPKQEMENTKDTSSRCYKSDEMQKPLEKTIIWQQLLSKICNTLRKGIFYCSPKNEGNNQEQPVSHTHTNKILTRKGRSINKEQNQPAHPLDKIK